MKKRISLIMISIMFIQVLCNLQVLVRGEDNAEYKYFIQNYDFSSMGMTHGQTMGTVKFPDTQNPDAWGSHGSTNPRSATYRSVNGEKYMEIINNGSIKSGSCYFWNNFPVCVTNKVLVEFDVRFVSGKTNIYLMSDSKYDGDDTASNVPTDWPNIIMDLAYDSSNKAIKFGSSTLLSNISQTDWCKIRVEADVYTKKLSISAQQGEKTSTLQNAGFTQTGKSNISILSFNPSASSQIDITNVTLAYAQEDGDTEITPSPTPNIIGSVIYNMTDENVLNETKELISQKPKFLKQMESLDRGLIGIKQENGVFLSWRLLGTEKYDYGFNIYRDGEKITDTPVLQTTNYMDYSGTSNSRYSVAVVIDGVEKEKCEEITPLSDNYLSIPMNIPAGGTTPAGEEYTYSVGDCSVGDLNGDGKYELVVKWDPSNAKDNSHDGYTGNVYIDGYTFDGKWLWRIDLGRNIRAGAHYTQFMVYDFDGNGISEIICKTADGTIDGKGKVIGNGAADYRNSAGRILTGPEYLTVFDGKTGGEIYTEAFSPARDDMGSDMYKIWGDANGNRSDRFLACVAYLDGIHPSVVMARGYYSRTVLTAYNFKDNKLEKIWTFDTSINASKDFIGKGNHNLSVGDVDYDGYDEIIFGSALIDHDGKGIDAGLGHGDAMHFGDLDPSRPGMEVFQVHESTTGEVNVQFRDARTNKMIWGVPYRKDIGRGISADIDPNFEGEECFANGVLYSAKGEKIGNPTNIPTNFVIWWDGDLQRELADSNKITKYNYDTKNGEVIMTADGCLSNNGTKSTPAIQADLFGDWREEIAFRTEDSSEVRIFTTTILTEYKFFTLMHDSVYREGIAWQNVAYNQPPHVGFFMGNNMQVPLMLDIYTVASKMSIINDDIVLGTTRKIDIRVDSDIKGVLVVASYNEHNSMNKIKVVPVDGSDNYTVEIATDDVAYVKVMLLEGLDSMKPLSNYLFID